MFQSRSTTNVDVVSMIRTIALYLRGQNAPVGM